MLFSSYTGRWVSCDLAVCVVFPVRVHFEAVGLQ